MNQLGESRAHEEYRSHGSFSPLYSSFLLFSPVLPCCPGLLRAAAVASSSSRSRGLSLLIAKQRRGIGHGWSRERRHFPLAINWTWRRRVDEWLPLASSRCGRSHSDRHIARRAESLVLHQLSAPAEAAASGRGACENEATASTNSSRAEPSWRRSTRRDGSSSAQRSPAEPMPYSRR